MTSVQGARMMIFGEVVSAEEVPTCQNGVRDLGVDLEYEVKVQL